MSDEEAPLDLCMRKDVVGSGFNFIHLDSDHKDDRNCKNAVKDDGHNDDENGDEGAANYINDLLNNAPVYELSSNALTDILNCVPKVDDSVNKFIDTYLVNNKDEIANITTNVQHVNIQGRDNAWDGSHGVIKKSKSLDASMLDTKTKIAVPVKVNEKGIQFAIRHMEDQRTIDLTSVGKLYHVSSNVNSGVFTIQEDDDLWRQEEDFIVPSTQELLKSAIKPRPLTQEDLWPQEEDFIVPSTQELLKSAIKPRPLTQEDLWPQEEDFIVPSTQGLVRTAIRGHPKKKYTRTPPAPTQSSRKINWLWSGKKYHMSAELFADVYDIKERKVKHDRYLYRKDSIGIEIDRLFPGCVIYVENYYPAIKFWKLRAYCAHMGCRKYCLTASHNNPTEFSVDYNQVEICHKQSLARQLRRYEREQTEVQLKSQYPNVLRCAQIDASEDETVTSGNFEEIKSLCVYQKVRSVGLAKQDNSQDDIADVEAMQTDDENSNFISNVLSKKNFAVYMHAKKQHDVLHKFHKIRAMHGIQIIGRLDASGGIAREIGPDLLLYYALTINVRILKDKKTTPLQLSEQFNIHHTSKNICLWLFDFVISHNSFHEDHPVLFDWLISDFSYANFHAILKAFNNISLKAYLNLAKTWITAKLKCAQFPSSFFEMVKVRMCYTHLMHTFADMTKRLYGKNKNKQLPHSRIILEILAAMIKATDYLVLLKCWEQLVILLKNEYVNDHVENAILEIKIATSPSPIDLDDFDEDKLTTAIDPETLPEYDNTLYQSNLFYIEFADIFEKIENYHYNEETKIKNVYYNPEFLDKFLKRFVPLIPFWTGLLNYTLESSSNTTPNLTLLDSLNNQPIENYFGYYKTRLMQMAPTIGHPPVKMGRAITLSQSMMNTTIKSINLEIPKSGMNSQKDRKPYVRKNASNSSRSTEGDPVQAQNWSENPKNSQKDADDLTLVNGSSVEHSKDPVPADISTPDNRSEDPESSQKDADELTLVNGSSVEHSKDPVPADILTPDNRSENPESSKKDADELTLVNGSSVEHSKDPVPADILTPDNRSENPESSQKDADELTLVNGSSVEHSKDPVPADILTPDNRSENPESSQKDADELTLVNGSSVEHSKDPVPADISTPDNRSENPESSQNDKDGLTVENGPNDQHSKDQIKANVSTIQTRNFTKKSINKQFNKESESSDTNCVSFNQAKESYNKKRPVKNFTYFQGKAIKKIAAKRIDSTPKIQRPKVFRRNGLWQNVKLYSSLNLDFVLCIKKGCFLTNKCFDALNPKMLISESLMKYLVNEFQQTTQVVVSQNGLIENLKFQKQIVFIPICAEDHWILLIINRNKQKFGFLNTNSRSRDLVQTLISKLQLEKWTDYLFQLNAHNDDYNSGIYIYKYMLQYNATGSVVAENDFCADIYRNELQTKLVKESENMKDVCLMCGIGENGMIMVECTWCFRWIHCLCINVNVKEIEADDKFKCPVCKYMKF